MNELSSIYRRRNSNPEYRNRVWQVLARWFGNYIKCTDSVLDLGCGYGVFINNIQCRKRFAMDLNPDATLNVERDVFMTIQDCSKSWIYRNNSLDVIFTSNFLEHLPDQSALRDTLKEAYRCLKPGGKLICIGPNIMACNGRYWSVIDHHLVLSHLSLAEALSLAGFHLEECYPKFLPLSMNDGKEYPMWMIDLYLHVPMLWKLFGEQFLIVATK